MFRNFLKVIFKKNIRIHYECEGGIEKIVLRINFWHHEACQVRQTLIPSEGFFYPTLTRIMVSFSCSQVILHFMLKKRLPVPEYVEM